jgi:hypothetical protein
MIRGENPVNNVLRNLCKINQQGVAFPITETNKICEIFRVHARQRSNLLFTHLLLWLASDGIPNILTCDDAIVTGKPQKKMSKEKIASLASMDPEDFTNFIRLGNWKRNSLLIDFTKIPQDVVDRILTSYHEDLKCETIKLDYFISNNIQDLITEFV